MAEGTPKLDADDSVNRRECIDNDANVGLTGGNDMHHLSLSSRVDDKKSPTMHTLQKTKPLQRPSINGLWTGRETLNNAQH